MTKEENGLHIWLAISPLQCEHLWQRIILYIPVLYFLRDYRGLKLSLGELQPLVLLLLHLVCGEKVVKNAVHNL